MDFYCHHIFGKKRDVINWLEILSGNGDVEKIDMITGGRKDYFKNFPRNPLPYAADVKTARYLLEHGADPNYRDSNGYRLIDRAMERKDEEMIELLKEFGQMVIREYSPNLDVQRIQLVVSIESSIE
jgi:ankyrin repeat protein